MPSESHLGLGAPLNEALDLRTRAADVNISLPQDSLNGCRWWTKPMRGKPILQLEKWNDGE